MSSKNKFYIVVKGKKPGIYTSWFGKGGAYEQIDGVQQALYKGFTTVEAAQEWLYQVKAPQLIVQLDGMRGRNNSTDPTSSVATALNSGKVVIFTDGGALKNPGPGGYGVVLLHKKKKKELSGGFRLTTNNRMELLACIAGLEALKCKCSIILFSDSKYVVDGISKGWAQRWRARGWWRTKNEKAKNSDLWERLLNLCAQHSIDFKWVKGHAGDQYNERCDQLANTAAQGHNLPPDTVFEAEMRQ